DYSVGRQPGTYRIALLGASMTLGAGVPFQQTIKPVLEERLNREGPGASGRHYEILNFSVGAYSTLQQAAVADHKVFSFKPDAILVCIFSVETGRMTDFLMQLVKTHYPIPYPYVQQKLQSTGATASMESPELLRRLGPISDDLVRWSYRHILEAGRRQGVPVVGVVLPEPRPRPRGRSYGDIDEAARLASSAGLPLLDLRGLYAGQIVDSLRLGGTDGANPHWNARGHKLAADRLYEMLQQNDAQTLRLGFKK
ncbi:MAG: hypothetical protein M3P18_16115, partial [Actinomycetota bacterium]|nr:hypothetical protein [Actinomycetota bacterium]